MAQNFCIRPRCLHRRRCFAQRSGASKLHVALFCDIFLIVAFALQDRDSPWNNFRKLSDSCSGLQFVSVAHTPTVTLPRLKAMMMGELHYWHHETVFFHHFSFLFSQPSPQAITLRSWTYCGTSMQELKMAIISCCRLMT